MSVPSSPFVQGGPKKKKISPVTRVSTSEVENYDGVILNRKLKT